MEWSAWVMVSLLGLSFLYGIWMLLIRDDTIRPDRNDPNDYSRRKGRRKGPSFSEVRMEIEQRLALISNKNRVTDAAARKVSDAERARLAKLEAEDAARRAAEDADRRKLEEAEADARRAELEAVRLAEEEERRRFAEEEEARRKVEEERLAAEAEELRIAAEAAEAEAAEEAEKRRQEELAAAEAQRLAELEEQRLAEMVQSQAVEEETAAELRRRLEQAGGRIGDVNVSLMWNNYNDLDLHVVCPSGERLHGGNRHSACKGELDVDANVKPETKKPVENVVWDIGDAPNGVYRVYVHHYKKHKKRGTKDPTKFKVIINSGGEFSEYNAETSHGDPIMLITEFEMKERSPEEEAARLAVIAEAEAAEKAERDAREAAEAEERRKAEEEAEAARLAAEEEQRKAEAEAEAARIQAEEDAKSAAEEAERQRQADLAAAEQARLDEITAAEEASRQEAAQARVQAEEVAAETQRELRRRLEQAGGRIGDVNISLMWNNYNDLDLHVVCPSGERIHGGNRNSACKGELDVDANVKPENKKPVENVVWDIGDAPDGRYQIYVHHYKKHKKRRTKDPTQFKVILGVKEEFTEFNSEVTHGEPIKFISDFNIGDSASSPSAGPAPPAEPATTDAPAAEPPTDPPGPAEDPLAAFMDDDEPSQPEGTFSLD